MNRITRRAIARTVPFAALLTFAGCSTAGTGGVTLAQAQAYVADGVGALQAAAAAFLAAPSTTSNQATLVKQIVADMATAASGFAGITDVSTARSTALSILGFMQQISPLVAPFAGAAGPLIPVAILVIQAFIQSLPLPAGAPATPPAALHAMALRAPK